MSESRANSTVFVWAALSFFALVLVWLSLGFSDYEESETKERPLLPVTVLSIAPAEQRLHIELTGLTEARWVTGVVASVQGRVEQLPDQLEPGRFVDEGEMLLKLLPTTYQAAVDSAESRLASTRLNLARARYEQTVALRQKGKTHTPLARHELQVEAAGAEQRAAESAVAEARQQLNDTRVTAPFDAIVLQRQVTPAQWVQPGDLLFQLADRHSLDVRVALPEQIWQRLGDRIEVGLEGEVVTHSGTRWPATLRYLSPTRAEKTRQRELVMEVKEPYGNGHTLLPDQQVDVLFEGANKSGVFEAPASVLTADGKIWLVDTNNQLQQLDIELLHQGAEKVLFSIPTVTEGTVRLVLYPLGSMLSGQQVEAREQMLEAQQ